MSYNFGERCQYCGKLLSGAAEQNVETGMLFCCLGHLYKYHEEFETEDDSSNSFQEQLERQRREDERRQEEEQRFQQQMQLQRDLAHPAPIVVNGKYANCGTSTNAVFSCTSNDGLNIGGATVTNNSMWLSGDLKAQLYFCKGDKNNTRYLMKEVEIGILNPDFMCTFSFPSQNLSDPPTDLYFSCVVVSELTAGGGYVTVSEMFLNENGNALPHNYCGKQKAVWQHSTNEHEPRLTHEVILKTKFCSGNHRQECRHAFPSQGSPTRTAA